MTKNWDKYLAYSILGVTFVVSVIIIFSTTNSFGGGDHYNHYKLAHWGWKYPVMLFNHWGKPVFTILISPFAQFGINGARLFNLLMGIITAFFCWKIAEHFSLNHAWLTTVLVLYMPIYFILMFTSLTEVTFSFFLVLSIYLFFKEKHIFSAIILSFLPLVRTEGIILFPLFIIAWLLKSKYKALPFISVGFIVISLIGWPFHENLWWLITEMPYTGRAKEIYGSGELLHFINHRDKILGSYIGYAFLLSAVVVIIKWIVNDHFRFGGNFYFILLIIGSFVGFFAAHSYVWWKGIGNSLGLIRVIGSVTPLAAIVIVAGISPLYDYKKRWFTISVSALLVVLFILFVKDSVNRYKSRFDISEEQKVIAIAADYVKKNKLNKHKIYYYNSFLEYKLNIDPGDRIKGQKHLPRNENFITSVPDSSIIIWDAHFGPNEGRMPILKLMEKKELVVIKVFQPKKKFKVLGGHNYQVVIFQKISSEKSITNKWYNDFENSQFGSTEKAFKGNKSLKIEKNERFNTFLGFIYREYSDSPSPLHIDMSFAYNYPEKLSQKELLLVCSLESAAEILLYDVNDLFLDNFSENTWVEKSIQFNLPFPQSINDEVKIYIWNKGGKVLFVDEVKIEIRKQN